MNQVVYDLIIIGLGPAGITAGIYAQRQNLNCLIIGKSFGGQMASKAVDIENYPGFDKISGLELIEKMVEHLKKREIAFSERGVVAISKSEMFEVLSDSGEKFLSRTVIMATGAEPRHLGVENENEFIGKGVSYCTTCDGPLFRNKDVAIIGGGDAGFEAARFFSRYANKVYLVEKGSKFMASAENQDIVRGFYPKVETFLNAEILKVFGDKFVTGIQYRDLQDGESKMLEVSGVFVQIGYVPATDLVKDLVDLNEKKEIIVNNDNMQTRTEGLFAAGDVVSGRVKQIIVACSDGAKAAISAYKYLNNK
jgi:thioredoxin-disulfide reductase